MGNGNDWDIDPPSEQSSSDNANDPYRSSGGGEGGRGGGGRGGHGSGGAGPTGPSGGGSSGRGGGGEPMSPMEGWGGGPFDFNELVENTKIVFRRIKGPILTALIGIVVINLLVQWLQSGIQIAAGATGADILALLNLPLAIVMIPVGAALGSLQLAILGPVRDKIFHGRSFNGAWDVVSAARERWLQVFLGMIVFAIGLIPTLMCCLFPGIAYIYVTLMVFYLLATRDIGIKRAFERSYILTKKYWQTVLTLFAAVIGLSLLTGCVGGVAGGILGGVLGDPMLARGVASAITRPIGLIVGLGIFITMASVFMTIDAHETGESIR